MMHRNFTESSEIATLLSRYDTKKTPVVSIMQYSGGLSFTHVMTPAQARELAADLHALADEAESEAEGMDKGMAKPVPPPPPPPPPCRTLKYPFG